MDTQLTHAARIELARSLRRRYQAASSRSKKQILEEFIAVSGYHPKYAVHLLNAALTAVPARQLRMRPTIYDAVAKQALVVLWEASDRVCGKRLKPLLRLLVPALERHGHLKLDDVIRCKVLSMSAATIDRLLRTARNATRARKPRRVTPEIRRRIPVRTFADWNDPPPGSMEMDLVAHCSESNRGSYVYSLTLTDIASGWTECAPLVDLLLKHKAALFDHLVSRWRDLFNVSFDVLLYDLTCTYFEIDPPLSEEGKRQFGYSRDHRSDCVQVVIALVVTPQGFPLAYEVLAGNTADNTTLKDFLARIEHQYGKARRTWLMDRGIPTEEVLEQMRRSEPPVQYLVGTPKGRLTALEHALLQKPWQQARPDVRVKLLPQERELYVFAESKDRIAKERGMRRRQLKWLWARLKKLSTMKLTRDALLMKLGAAQSKTPQAWRLATIEVAVAGTSFGFWLSRKKLREARRREGRYLLRTNLTESDPAKLWEYYLHLVAVEEAFKTLQGDLSIRPIYHQHEDHIEAHIFIAFLAYCLHVTLGHRLKHVAPGLTTRSVLEKFSAVQMIDVRIPTTDRRELTLTRYTQPEPELQLLLERLKLTLPAQPPPKITAAQATTAIPV